MIEKLFTRKESDNATRQRFDIYAGWRYGIVFGVLLLLIGWGVDAWESADASLEYSWAKLPIAAMILVPLFALAGRLAARSRRMIARIAIWGIAGAISGWIAIHLPFECVSTVAAWIDPTLRGAAIFPFEPAVQERVIGLMVFGVIAGMSAAWVQRLASYWAWDRSSSDNRMTFGGWATLLICAPIAIGLGSLYDGGANASLRGPAHVTHRLIQVALNTPPGLDLNHTGLLQTLDYAVTIPWRDRFTAHYTQSIADFDRRALKQAYVDTRFDNGFLWRCQITRDASNVRRCFDLGGVYGDWIAQFLSKGQIRCEDCFLRVEPEALAWQNQYAKALGNPKSIQVMHYSGGLVIVRVAYDNRSIECRIMGAEPVNLRECKMT